ncbi:MAG: EAL domain-containing protein [Alphaproteobacteria bacterium]|nr:EAL domain-containing protein [Alphaproteobacteria bacterium]
MPTKRNLYTILLSAGLGVLSFSIFSVAFMEGNLLLAFLCLLLSGTSFLSIGITLFREQQRQAENILDLLNALTLAQSKLSEELQSLKNIKDAHSGTSMTVIPEEIKVEVRLVKSLIKQLSEVKGDQLPEEVNFLESSRSEEEKSNLHELINYAEISKYDEEFSPLDQEELSRLVEGALHSDKIEILLQPVVSLPDQKVKYYECYSRLRAEDGSLLSPEHYLEIAEKEGLMSAVDNTMLFRCVQLARRARKQNPQVGFFCNISKMSLLDAGFIEGFIDFIRLNKELTSGLIFEIHQSTLRSSSLKVRSALLRLKDQGCPLSIDFVKDLNLDAFALYKQGVRFIKVECKILMKAFEEDPKKVKKLKESLKKTNIKLIITKVEDKEKLSCALKFNADLAQGYVISPPRLTPIQD